MRSSTGFRRRPIGERDGVSASARISLEPRPLRGRPRDPSALTSVSKNVQPSVAFDRSLPADWSVERGRDAYLAENGFSVAAYDEPWTPVSLWGISFSIPNTPRHRWAIRLHDLHHVATGFGTDLTGEAEISAWEARRGLAALDLYVSSIVSSLAATGLVIAPRRTLRAWNAAVHGTTLFNAKHLDYASLLRLSIGELRNTLGIERGGLASTPRKLHGRAPERQPAT
jgi:hypothetical protein